MIKFMKDNGMMIGLTIVAIVLFKVLVPEEHAQTVFILLIVGIFECAAVYLGRRLLPGAIRTIHNAESGHFNPGPLTPGIIVDAIPVTAEDEDEIPGYLYVVSFRTNDGADVQGFTEVRHEGRKYCPGDFVELWKIEKQPDAPDTEQNSCPTYDVNLWDEKSISDNVVLMKVVAWASIGMVAIFALVPLVAALLLLCCQIL